MYMIPFSMLSVHINNVPVIVINPHEHFIHGQPAGGAAMIDKCTHQRHDRQQLCWLHLLHDGFDKLQSQQLSCFISVMDKRKKKEMKLVL